MTPSARWTLATLLLCLPWTSPNREANRQQTMVVRVIDELDRPVASAVVELGAPERRFTRETNAAGVAAFVFESSTIRVALRVRAVGYQPLSDSVSWLHARDTVTVHLARLAERLADVEVRDRAPSVARLGAVDRRIANRTPSASVTRAEIEKRNPIALSRMLRGIAGLRLADSSGATVAISTRGVKLEKLRPVPCVMRVMLDGIILSGSTDIDQIPPIDVHAIEVYFGAARIPPELAGIRADAWCGLIAVWTRSG